jgi:hypothetical protein
MQLKNIKLLPQQFLVINKHWKKTNPRLIGTNISIHLNQKIEIKPCDKMLNGKYYNLKSQIKTVGMMIVC